MTFSLMTGSVYYSSSLPNKQMQFYVYVNGIERASQLEIKASLDLSNNKHIRKLDTLIAAERSKILRRYGLT